MIRIVPPDDYGPLDDGVRARRRVRLDRVLERATPSTRSSSGCSASPHDLRALEGRQAVRRRAGDRRAAGAARPEGRSRCRPSTAPRRVVQRASSETGDVRGLQRAAAARRHRPRGDRRRAAQAAAPTSPRWSPIGPSSPSRSAKASPTSTACCSSGASTSSRSRARRRCATSCDVLGAEPAADLLRTTVVASIGPVTAEAAAQCDIQTTIMPAQLHDSGAGRRDRRALSSKDSTAERRHDIHDHTTRAR